MMKVAHYKGETSKEEFLKQHCMDRSKTNLLLFRKQKKMRTCSSEKPKSHYFSQFVNRNLKFPNFRAGAKEHVMNALSKYFKIGENIKFVLRTGTGALSVVHFLEFGEYADSRTANIFSKFYVQQAIFLI